ncbi:MAG: hypothetical protein ACRD3G_28880, partial [Vicinamibacterales bacterium]
FNLKPALLAPGVGVGSPTATNDMGFQGAYGPSMAISLTRMPPYSWFLTDRLDLNAVRQECQPVVW